MSGQVINTETLAIRAPSTTDERRQAARTRRDASLTLAEAVLNDPAIRSRARQRDQLRDWLDMLGLPPCERPMRTAAKIKAYQRQKEARDAAE